jgi:hypothetical protein
VCKGEHAVVADSVGLVKMLGCGGAFFGGGWLFACLLLECPGRMADGDGAEDGDNGKGIL